MPKKIAVLRANALGDFIFILPAVVALRNTFPDAEIVLLGKEMHQEFLRNRPSPFNSVVVIPPYPGVGEAENYQEDPLQIDAFFADMQKEQFNIAFQFHGGGFYSNPFVSRLGATLTVGFKTPNAVPLDISLPYTTYFSETLRYLEAVSYVGAKTTELVPRVAVTETDVAEAGQFILQAENRPIVVMQPGARDTRRRWPADNFARVANVLIDQGFFVCLNGVEDEAHLSEMILSLLHDKSRAVNLCGRVSLSALIGILSNAALVISNDTGPLHLAYALQRPAVGIYWAPNMVTGTPMISSLARPLISWEMNCPLCGAGFKQMKNKQGHCDHNVSFVAAVSVEEVLTAVQEIIGDGVHTRQLFGESNRKNFTVSLN